MKVRGLTLLFVLIFAFGFISPNSEKGEYAYVCGKSKIFHTSQTHAALDRCKSGITKMLVTKAKSLGKRECECNDK